MKKLILFICACLFICAAEILPQDKTLHEQFKENFKKKYFSVGLLFKSLADFQIERSFPGKNGFSVIKFRLKFTGELDEGFGYYLQTEFTKSPALLDAILYYKILKNFRIDIGQFKAPFSTEQLTSESSLPFVERSLVTDELPPKRQLGLQLSAATSDKLVEVKAGVFNGNGTQPTNDNQNFLYAGQVIVAPKLEEKNKLTITGNAAFSNDATSSFNGDKTLLGGDIVVTLNKFELSSEFIHRRLEYSSGAALKSYGYHVTGAFNISEIVQVLARWNYYRPDASVDEEDKQIILGSNISPTDVIRFQINYTVDNSNSSFKHHQLLIVTQLAL